MKLLVAEDDQRKAQQIADHITSVCADRGIIAEVLRRMSYQSGLRECIASEPDILVLDMTMPTFDIALEEQGGRPRHFAGRDILRELYRRQLLIPTIVVTGFDVIGEGAEQCTRAELTKELEREFGEMFRGTVFYTSPESAWKAELTKILDDILKV